jgi:oxaloacetate decarboxylase gamma subunit
MEKLQPLILQSLELLVIGMGTVFIILGLLIFLINMVAKLVIAMKLEEEAAHFPSTTGAARPLDSTQDDELVAVISSAVTRYRKQH